MKGASGESKGLRRYDKENLLWQFTVAIRSDPVGSGVKRAIPLATAGAFHSAFMQSAREKLAPVLDGISFAAPKFPVLSNVTGRPHSDDPAAIKAAMLEQVTGTTNWAADVEAAKALGCGMFVEFGPGKVLSGLVKKIDAALATSNVADLASLDATVAALA